MPGGGGKTTRKQSTAEGDGGGESESTDLASALRSFERTLRAYRAVPESMSLAFNARIGPEQEIKSEWHYVFDPVVGRLTSDGVLRWTTVRNVPGFGDSMPIHVDIPNSMERRKSGGAIAPRPPTAPQRNAFRKFMDDPERFRRIVEESNWRFYQQNVLDESDEGLPADVIHLKKPAEVWKLLSKPSIIIPVQTGSGWTIKFCWECRWDEEHGHKVVLRNGKETYIGQQGGE